MCALVSVLLVLPACTGGDGPPAGSSDAKTVPHPLEVTTTVDKTHAGTATIGAAGGKVSVKVGGVTYRLEVPQGALASEEKITLRPITAIKGMPKTGKLLGAVDMQPAGLQFGVPAILAIDGIQDGGNLAPFAIADDTHELYLTPRVPTSTGVRIIVPHFSGTGVAATQGSSWATYVPSTRERWVNDVQTRLREKLALEHDDAVISEITGKETTGSSAVNEAQIASLAYVLLNEGARGRLEAAKKDYRAVVSAARYLLSIERQFELLGMTDPKIVALLAEMHTLLDEAIDHAIKQLETDCVAKQDFTTVGTLTALVRSLQLGGKGDELGLPKLAQVVKRCFAFEVDIDLTWDAQFKDESSHKEKGHVSVKGMKLRTEGLELSHGSKRLTYDAYTQTQSVTGQCDYSTTGLTPTRPVELTAEVDLTTYPSRYFLLDGSLGEATEQFLFSCPGISKSLPDNERYTEAVKALTASLPKVRLGTRFARWDKIGGRDFAKHTYALTGSSGLGGGASYRGTLKLTVRHTPD